MANAVRVQPDLQFVKELQAVGGDDLKKCYQCATCSVACPLAPADGPFPRKEMVWAQWGLKDKLLSDIDIWLCHNCQTCSDLCPRGARPGDVLAALRNMTYRNLTQPTIIGKWMSSVKYLPNLIAIPAILYLVIWMIRASQLGTFFPLFDGKVIYGGLFPGDFTIDPIFGLLFAFVAFTFYKGVMGLIDSFKSQPKTFVVGHKPEPWYMALFGVLKDEIATHKKFNECGQDNTERFQGHLALFYGFVALFIVTSAVAIGHWGGYVLHWLEPLGHTPMPLYHPMKLLAQVGAVLLLYGLTMLTRRRLNADPAKAASSYYDWFLLGVIWAVALTGVFSQLLRWANVATLAYPMYYLHLIAVFMLIGYLPWGKLGHLVYRTAALTYARMIGRRPI